MAWLPAAVLFSAAISVAVLWLIAGPSRRKAVNEAAFDPCRSVFLVKDGRIIDQTNGIKDLSGWHDLKVWLGDRFRDLPDDLNASQTGPAQVFRADTPGDCAELTIQNTPQGQSITLTDGSAHCATDRHALLQESKHSHQLRSVLEHAPAIVFAIDDTGLLKWGNAKFEGLSIDDRKIFLKAARERHGDTGLRTCLEDPMSAREQHFELSILPGDTHTVIYANDVTRLVEADSVRNAFVQTLTKTFADLSTGLAVFDHDHRLVLFNPAILDLTDLSAEFLSARPHMMEFFDRLRDNHMLPEPKSYSTWRRQITDMITSAANGHYSESWSLPGGLTYKLTGRPHPNGAIAFLIEDITDEMALTRQSRSQLETHQAILDAIQEAIAVIGPDGGLVVCNAAFVDIFGFDPDSRFARTSLKDLMQACRDRFPGSTIWDDLGNGDTITPINTQLRDGSGATTNFRIEPLPEGLFMLNLSRPSPAVPLSA
ncbi:MAG: PAS-domain containing protein [Pseudomonadota bacterium]